MATTSDIRNGLCIRYNHDIFKVIEFLHVKPGKGPAFVRTKLKSVTTGKVIDNTFSAGHKIDDVRVETHKFQYLYPEVDIYEHFAGYKPEETTKTWFWDNHANGGAFALFKPGQFKSLYPTLLTPEFNGSLHFAGECCSVHHGWIVGALDSAYNAVLNILKQAGAHDKIKQMETTWGQLSSPDIALTKKKQQLV